MKTTNAKQTFILNLLDKLVTPAFGCTEIGCIAFATSIASENLKSPLAKATVYVSGFIYRNVINVGVPLIGKIGAKGIAAAGFIVKQSHKKLLILENVSKTQVNLIKKLADTNKIKVVVQKHCDPVYVKVIAKDTNGNRCDVLIERKHDTVKHIRLNNINLPTETYTKTKSTNLFQPKFDVNDISLTDIYLTIKKVKIKDLDFLQKGINMNEDVANFPTRKNKYFHPIHEKLSWQETVLAHTFNAVASRMDGCPLPVMSSNDSGDHGLTVNLPQFVYHQKMHTTKLAMFQAIALANLITWKIKKNIGSLSAYCGSVVAAATGSICGIGLQRNYNINQINELINYCLNFFTGVLCDGAKISCAWKIESALSVGFKALESIEKKFKLNGEGINNVDAFKTIKLIGGLSKTIMNTTNEKIIDIIDYNLKR